jgi:hypothetical protein
MIYLDYLRTGGPPNPNWDKELRRLDKSGELDGIRAEYERQCDAGQW